MSTTDASRSSWAILNVRDASSACWKRLILCAKMFSACLTFPLEIELWGKSELVAAELGVTMSRYLDQNVDMQLLYAFQKLNH